MNANGHATLDGLLDALAERAGTRKSSRDEDSILGLQEKLDHVAAAIERLAELAERSRACDGAEPLLVTRRDAARMLAVSLSMLDVLRRRGQIAAVALGESGSPRFAVADLREFIVANKEKPSARCGRSVGDATGSVSSDPVAKHEDRRYEKVYQGAPVGAT